MAVWTGDGECDHTSGKAVTGNPGLQRLRQDADALRGGHLQRMPDRPERYDAMAHAVVRAVELYLGEVLSAALGDPGFRIVTEFY